MRREEVLHGEGGVRFQEAHIRYIVPRDIFETAQQARTGNLQTDERFSWCVSSAAHGVASIAKADLEMQRRVWRDPKMARPLERKRVASPLNERPTRCSEQRGFRDVCGKVYGTGRVAYLHLFSLTYVLHWLVGCKKFQYQAVRL